MISAQSVSSTRPYLIRALYEWCCDNGLTPYVAVRVDDSVQVPREYVKNGEIVLNMSMEATSALKLGNEFIEFKARFAGIARDIIVPVRRVIAIYARENGQGMAFPLEDTEGVSPGSMQSPSEPTGVPVDSKPVQLARIDSDRADHETEPEPPRPPAGPRPALKRIK